MDNAHDIPALVREHLDAARRSDHGRSARLLVHDGPLRQSIIALRAGGALDEHEAPPAASLHVLAGKVRLNDRALSAGELVPIPHERHALSADEDAAVLLTTVTGI
ncbi:cupin [Actinomadura parmotrematis]|uniref:Cupin n=1 Tax=Actinomadura parmotrematis TaxID=2864039 RepID=A0ABS7FQC1_9ACTN|nr:cupin [Actinomadura parmotrematis]MBW8482425.1 cupin [Actinomadura parmotrematis]